MTPVQHTVPTPSGQSAPSSDRAPLAKIIALLVIGHGIYLLGYCSVAGIAFTSYLADGWEQVLPLQFAFFFAGGLGCLGTRRWLKRRDSPTATTAALACAAVVAARLAGMYACILAHAPLAVALLLALGLGGAAGYPLVFWACALGVIYQAGGRMRCIGALAGEALVAASLSALASPLLRSPAGLLAFCLGAVGVGTACQVMLARSVDFMGPCAHAWHRSTRRYRLTPYSSAVIASLGVTVGITGAFRVYTYTGTLPSSSYWTAAVAPIVACCAILALAVRHPRSSGMRFGLIVRLLIAGVGFTLALLPYLYETAPQTALACVRIIFVLQVVVITLFSIEVSYTDSRELVAVMPVNYAAYSAFACLGALAFWLAQRFVGGHAAWDLIAATAVLATVVVIPLLPAASSDAVAFTLRELPENENRERRAARITTSIASAHGLSEREEEVLGLLVAGFSRQEIAERLTLSSWTVKDHIGNVYRKTSVHSYQELMALVQRAEQGGR